MIGEETLMMKNLAKEWQDREESRLYVLEVKFLLSKEPVKLHTGTHHSCLEMVKNVFIPMIKAEHDCHRTGFKFNETMVGPDIVQLHAEMITQSTQFKKSVRLWCVFTIKPLASITAIEKTSPKFDFPQDERLYRA